MTDHDDPLVAAYHGALKIAEDLRQAIADRDHAIAQAEYWNSQTCEQEPVEGCPCAGCHTMAERAAHSWSDEPKEKRDGTT